jgi:NADH-quinone oxidoreductase subunit K
MVEIGLEMSYVIFFISFIGAFSICRNLLVLLLNLEIMTLAIIFMFTLSSYYVDDIHGQSYVLFIITLAAVESAIGLAVLIMYSRVNSISLNRFTSLKG